VREHLEKELGETKILKAYPVLKEFGDGIFFDDSGEELKEKLKGILTEAEIKRYQNYFASLIFMELEAEKVGGGA